MQTIRLKIDHPAMYIYENDPDQAQVFTYELSKVCDQQLDNWSYADGILTIDHLSGLNNQPDIHEIKDCVLELCAWQVEVAK